MVFPDTNILVYAQTDDRRHKRANEILLEPHVISAQSLNEFVHVARRQLRWCWSQIDEALETIIVAAETVVPITVEAQRHAVRLAKRYRLATYDAQIVASALEAGCDTVFSVDMRDGLLIDACLHIRNPFA